MSHTCDLSDTKTKQKNHLSDADGSQANQVNLLTNQPTHQRNHGHPSLSPPRASLPLMPKTDKNFRVYTSSFLPLAFAACMFLQHRSQDRRSIVLSALTKDTSFSTCNGQPPFFFFRACRTTEYPVNCNSLLLSTMTAHAPPGRIKDSRVGCLLRILQPLLSQ